MHLEYREFRALPTPSKVNSSFYQRHPTSRRCGIYESFSSARGAVHILAIEQLLALNFSDRQAWKKFESHDVIVITAQLFIELITLGRRLHSNYITP